MKSKKGAESSTSEAEIWLRYARDDREAALLLRSRGHWNLACFHAQQGVEKALKAFLQAHTGNSPKIHALPKLLRLCSSINRQFLRYKAECVLLDKYYVPTRYPVAAPGTLPEGLPDQDDARRAIADMRKILRYVSTHLKQTKTLLGF